MKQLGVILIALAVAALAMSCGGRNLGADGDSGIIAAALDNTPPANVIGFTVQPALGRLILSWTNPPDADFAGVRILRKTTNDITGPNDPTATVACGGDLITPQANCTDTGLNNGTTYYYKLFSYDIGRNYAAGVDGSGTPACSSIEDIRSLHGSPTVNNSRFSLAGCTLPQVTVTMVHRDGSNMGFYIQQTQGGAGIFVFTASVNPTDTWNLTPGDRITFAGSLWANLCVAAFNQQLQIVKKTGGSVCNGTTSGYTAASFTTGDFSKGAPNANYLAELATTVSGNQTFSTDFVNGAEGRLYVFSTPVNITGAGDTNIFPASFGGSTAINVRKTELVKSLLTNGAQFIPGRAVIGRFNSDLELRIYGTGAGGTTNYDGITPGGGENGFGIKNLPPTVSSTTPANGATGVALSSTIAVTFSKAMNTSTVTAQTAAGACSGSVQVSLDNFSTCIAMTSAAPTFSGGNSVATFTPATALTASTTYKIRVTTAVQDAAGNAMAAQFETATGFTTGTGAVNIYSFTNWTANPTPGIYPSGMSFKCVRAADVSMGGSGVADNFPVSVPIDDSDLYSGATNVLATAFGVRGEGANGISMLNTASANAICTANGAAGYIGALDVTTDTTGRTSITVSWKAAQASDQPREWGVRLQYNCGSGFTDVSGPVEWLSSTVGTSLAFTDFGPTTLPAECNNNPNVRIRWKYYSVSGTSGSRTRIIIDDISIDGM